MNSDKITALLGFCRKAGKLVAGTSKVTDLIQSGKDCLVMLASDISEKTEKELSFKAKNKRAVIIRLDILTSDVAKATGTTAGVVATADEGFYKAILQGGKDL